MRRIKFFDATLRDGNHAVKHQLTEDNIEDYCVRMDSVGVDAIIIGHGNGLGASSLQVGLAKVPDERMLSIGRENLRKTKLGAYMIPGYGTIRDNLDMALDIGVDMFKIGCHCTEADTTKQHIEYLAQKHKEVYGVLMMYHMTSSENLLEQARKMQEYGAKGVIIMDSAGASTPELVKRTITTLTDNLSMEVGFHAHNNLGLAVSNTYEAILCGATIVDATLRGFGAGAGNCQLETLVALLKKQNYDIPLDLYRMMDTSEELVSKWWEQDKGIDDISIVNGMAGTFSAFKVHVINAAKTYGVDPRDILMEAGKRKTVGGQEDVLIEIARELSMTTAKMDESYYLSSLL